MTRPALALAVLALFAPAAQAQLPGQGFSSDNVELVTNIETGPTSGARLVNGILYVTTGRDLQIFDTTADPEHPVKVGAVSYPNPGPEEQRAPYEDPDTNGKVLVASVNGDIIVFDVRDPKAPKIAGTLPGAAEHTVSCVLDCSYIYGSAGAIVDIRDPTKPTMAGNWFDTFQTDSTHDVSEVAPGVVLTSSQPMQLLDARADPVHPVKLAEATTPGFVHGNIWPHQMADRILLVAGEGALNGCPDGPDASFMTFDTAGWQTSHTFKLLSEFRMQRGVFVDGSAPQTTFCTHWFEQHPSFRNTGLIAIGWYESGLRFLKVGAGGSIEELGYWLPVAARTSAAYWRTDRILYTADYYRGVDVLRWTGEIPPGEPEPLTADGPQPALPPAKRAITFDDFIRMPSARRCVKARSFAIRVRRTADRVTRVAVRLNGKGGVNAKGAKLRKPIRVRKLPRGRFTVQVLVRTRSGHQTAGQRTYRRC